MKKKIFFCSTISLFLIHNLLWAKCEFATSKPIISLSGPITHYFYQLGLHSNTNLKAISVFHGLTKEEFSGEILNGGMFISTKIISKYKDAFFFFDESEELKKALGQINDDQKLQVVTRGKNPFEAYSYIDIILKSYLNKDCLNLSINLAKKINQIEDKIKSSKGLSKPFLFFMGKIQQNNHYPELLMVNDGPALYMIKELNNKSYPAPLAYVRWSEKILHTFIKNEKPYIFALQTEGGPTQQQGVYQLLIEPNTQGYYNLYSRSAFIPGLPQIYFLDQLIEYFTP